MLRSGICRGGACPARAQLRVLVSHHTGKATRPKVAERLLERAAGPRGSARLPIAARLRPAVPIGQTGDQSLHAVYLSRVTVARKIVFLLAAFLLAATALDCLAQGQIGDEAMACCRSMPCTPANQSHDCCKTMVSGRTPSVLPTARTSLHAPPVAVVGHAPMLEVASLIPVLTPPVEPQQHSPPELYTLHLSLLI